MTDKKYCERTGKIRFPSPGAAVRTLQKHSKRSRGRKVIERRNNLTIYHCRSCGGYHLGRKYGTIHES